MNKLAMLLATAIVAFAISGSDAHAQTTRITGKVVDKASGDKLEGASVTFKHIATGKVLEGTTTSKGTYRIPNVPFGGFEVTVEKPGYPSFRTTYTVEARTNEATVVNVELAR